MSHLQTSEQTILQLARKHPLLRAPDLARAGLPTIALTQLVSAGKLERVGRGVYSLPTNQAVSENRSPRPRSGCPAGLAAWYQRCARYPREIWLAIPHRMLSPRIEKSALRVVRMSGPSLTEGIDRLKVDGVEVPVFNAAKTIADYFKFRNRIGLDVALEALRDAWYKRKVTMDRKLSLSQCNSRHGGRGLFQDALRN